MLKPSSLLIATALLLAMKPAMAQTVLLYTGGAIPNINLPLNQATAYSAYEAIYLQPRINRAGTITRLAFEKNDGSDLRSLDGVSLYLKTTAANQMATGPIDTTGYQLVFRGSFPNAAAASYQEILLSQPFAYDNTGNLSLLVTRRNGQALSAATTGSRARWLCGTGPTNIARRFNGTPPLTSTSELTATTVLANVLLTFSTATATRNGTAGPTARLFPVPATDAVTLDAAQWTGPLTYFITDALGRTVRPATALPLVASGQHQFNISELRGGTYHLHLSSATRHEVLQLVRE